MEEITKEASELANPFLNFVDLSQEDLITFSEANQNIDIDGLTLVGQGQILFSNEVLCIIDSILGTNNPIVNNKCRIERLYSVKAPEVFHIAKMGHFMLSVVKNTPEISDDNEIIEPINLSQAREINSILRNIGQDSRTITFQNFISFILRYFSNESLCIYGYGQKKEITNDIKSTIISLTRYQISVEIAIANQFYLSGFFVSSKINEQYKEFAFSNFLSNVAVNYRINNRLVTNRILEKSSRIVIYNTFQHCKVMKDLSLTTRNVSNYFDEIFESYIEHMNWLISVRNQLNLAGVRYEIYSLIESESDFLSVEEAVTNIPHYVDFVKISMEDLDEKISQINCKLISLFENARIDNDSILPLLTSIIYGKFVSFIKSFEKIERSFTSSNFSVFLPRAVLNEDFSDFSNSFFIQYPPKRIYKLLSFCFGENEKSIELVTFFFVKFLMKYIENDIPLELNVVNKISYYFIKKTCNDVPTNDVRYEICDSFNFFSKFKTKFSRNFFANYITDFVLRIYEINQDVFNQILQILQTKNILFKYQGIFYALQTESLSRNSYLNNFSIEELKIIVNNYSYNDALRNVTVFGQQNFKSLYLKILEELQIYQRDKKHSVTDIKLKFSRNFMDRDIIARILFCRQPDSRVTSSNVTTIPVISRFPSIVLYYKFMIYTICLYQNNGSGLSAIHQKRRDNIRNLVIPLRDGYRDQPVKMIYYTGLFSNPSYVPIDQRRNVCIFPDDQRLRLGTSLARNERLNLLQPEIIVESILLSPRREIIQSRNQSNGPSNIPVQQQSICNNDSSGDNTANATEFIQSSDNNSLDNIVENPDLSEDITENINAPEIAESQDINNEFHIRFQNNPAQAQIQNSEFHESPVNFDDSNFQNANNISSYSRKRELEIDEGLVPESILMEIVNSNFILNPIKLQILKFNFEIEDFQIENKAITVERLGELFGWKSNYAETVLKILKCELFKRIG